jgi:hypothetical protein
METKFVFAKRTKLEEVFRWLVGVFLLVGIITAALDLTFGAFAPIYWFWLSLMFLLITICHEAYRIATMLENKK